MDKKIQKILSTLALHRIESIPYFYLRCFFFCVFEIHAMLFGFDAHFFSRDRGGLLVSQCLCTCVETGHYPERQGGIRSAVAGFDTA